MSANSPIVTDTQQQDRRRKRKAILAGGVVLGLGAAVTLAAWSDDVFANGDFNTGSFNLIGSASTAAAPALSDYGEHSTTPGASLSFQINSLNMSPGETVAAPFSIAQSESPETTVDGRVWMYEATATGSLAPYLEYSIKVVDDPTVCEADDPATVLDESATVSALASWNEGDFTANPSTIENVAGQRGPTPADTQDLLVEQDFGNQQHLCIQVTLDDSEDAISPLVDPANPTSIVWQFRGESETPTA